MRPEQNNMMQKSWYLTSLYTSFNAEFQGPHCMVLSCEWHHWLQNSLPPEHSQLHLLWMTSLVLMMVNDGQLLVDDDCSRWLNNISFWQLTWFIQNIRSSNLATRMMHIRQQGITEALTIETAHGQVATGHQWSLRCCWNNGWIVKLLMSAVQKNVGDTTQWHWRHC